MFLSLTLNDTLKFTIEKEYQNTLIFCDITLKITNNQIKNFGALNQHIPTFYYILTPIIEQNIKVKYFQILDRKIKITSLEYRCKRLQTLKTLLINNN